MKFKGFSCISHYLIRQMHHLFFCLYGLVQQFRAARRPFKSDWLTVDDVASELKISKTVVYLRCSLIFLQYWPVGCKVKRNLSERVFPSGLYFAMANILNYDQVNKQHNYTVNCNLAVAKVAVRKICLTHKYQGYCNKSSCARSSVG